MGGGVGAEGTASGQWGRHTFYVGEGAERSSGTAARLLHVIALGGLIDLEGQSRGGSGLSRKRQAGRGLAYRSLLSLP